MPKRYDEEGRMYLPPKNDKEDYKPEEMRTNNNRETLSKIMGHSPDEADSLVIGYYALTHKPIRPKVGAI
jgi:hypothetical protein